MPVLDLGPIPARVLCGAYASTSSLPRSPGCISVKSFLLVAPDAGSGERPLIDGIHRRLGRRRFLLARSVGSEPHLAAGSACPDSTVHMNRCQAVQLALEGRRCAAEPLALASDVAADRSARLAWFEQHSRWVQRRCAVADWSGQWQCAVADLIAAFAARQTRPVQWAC